MKAIARRIRRPSPALVVGFVALLVALGGSTYAGTRIGKATSCGSSAVAVGGACVEKDLRPTEGWPQAVKTCAKLHRRLPTIAELNAAKNLGVKLGSPELVADIGVNSSRFDQTVLYSSGLVAVQESIGTQRRFRCVSAPS